jgi:hypothetical protein
MASLIRKKKLRQGNHNQISSESPLTKSDHDNNVNDRTSTRQQVGPLLSLDGNSPVSSPRVNGRRSLVKRNGFKKIRDKPSKEDKIVPNQSNEIPIETSPETKSRAVTTSSSTENSVAPVKNNPKPELCVETKTSSLENDNIPMKTNPKPIFQVATKMPSTEIDQIPTKPTENNRFSKNTTNSKQFHSVAKTSSTSNNGIPTNKTIPEPEPYVVTKIPFKENQCQKERKSTFVDNLHPQNFSEFETSDRLKIYVDDYSNARFLSLLTVLEKNKNVKMIEIFRKQTSDGFRNRSHSDMDHLFHILHTLAGGLNELNFWNLRDQDLTSLSRGMFGHQSIQFVQLRMESSTLDEETLKTFATLPNLISLELEVNESFPVWRLLESKSLAVLSVISNHFKFESADILPMAGKLETNSALQVLDIEPYFPSWCLCAIMNSIHSSRGSSLETFQFSCGTSNKKDGDNSVMDILRTITSYKSKLRVIWNHCYESFHVSEEIEPMVLLALQSSKSIEQFHIFVESEDFSVEKSHLLDQKLEDHEKSNK